MRNHKRSISGVGLASAVAVAGASQAYGGIVPVTPPTNIVGVSNSSLIEYWDAATGTTSATNVVGVSDFSFTLQNTNVLYNGQPHNVLYSFSGNLTGATTAATTGSYAYAYNVPKGSTIGTGGAFANFTNNSGTLIQLSVFVNGKQYGFLPTGTPAYIGFQFTAADGQLHDGYLQLESDPYVSASSPGGITFFSAAYNSVADAHGGVIAAGAVAGPTDIGSGFEIIHQGSLSTVTAQAASGYNKGAWNGSTGIVSSTAAADTKHLTAVGVIQNSVDQTPGGAALYNTFEGQAVVDTDVLVKYTYYGDANLDGKVDGSDYSRIDNGYLTHATGWFNGDFNYDGVVNGSDYTLIDNAFNRQNGVIASQLASPTATITDQVAGGGSAAVPEPGTLSALAAGAAFLVGVGRGRHRVAICN